LHLSKVGTAGKQVSGKTVAQSVGADQRIDPDTLCIQFHQSPKHDAIHHSTGSTQQQVFGTL
jgi:hypothetical protein